MSAGRDLEQLTHQSLYSKLSLTEGHVDDKVLDQMIQLYGAAIPLASGQLLSKLYNLAKASPLSSTQANLREDEGLVFKGANLGGTSSRCVVTCAAFMTRTCLTPIWL